MRAGTSNAGVWLMPQERDETIKETGAKWRKMVLGKSPENSSVETEETTTHSQAESTEQALRSLKETSRETV